MHEKDNPSFLAELLKHAAWTRNLARGLVGEGAADDVVQETWIAALRRPPDTGQPLRPWLGTVVRNKVFNRSRGHARRASREAVGGAREAPESAESVLGRLEMHRMLVEVVGELPEPYRQTVLLAYFEELTSEEIGERHNVPASTVRGRLKTALELLREALDRRVGSRATWLPVVRDLARSASRRPRARKARADAQPAGTDSGSVGLGGGAALLPGVVCVVAIAATTALVWSVARRKPASSTEAASSSTARTLVGPDERGLTAAPVSTSASTRRPSRSDALLGLAYVPFEWPSKPCSIATHPDLPIASACASRGRPGAAKVMTGLVMRANARGENYTCDGCHRNRANYYLKPHAREDLERLLAIVAAPDVRKARPSTEGASAGGARP